MKTAVNELGELLSEPLTAAIERESHAFDRASAPFGERVVLYGAGRLGKHILACMRKVGLEPLAFADNNPALDGNRLEGLPVYSPLRAAELYGKSASFVITVWNSSATDRMKDRMQRLKDLGCDRVFPVGLLCWKYPEAFLPYYPLDLPHKALSAAQNIIAALGLFSDDASRKEYLGQVRFRLLLDYAVLGPSLGADYYFRSDFFEFGPDEVLIDCGAFDGDTVADFVRLLGDSFRSIVAFEPDPQNWEKLQTRLNQLPQSMSRKIKSLPYALGSSACTVQFNATGTDAASIGNGSVSVECVTLDQALRDVTPTFIKFDIEGAEPDALAGAHALISRSRPVLAVSCYHQQSHLWEIPLELARICHDYQFFLRSHGVEGWDLLCYAVPRERLRRRD